MKIEQSRALQLLLVIKYISTNHIRSISNKKKNTETFTYTYIWSCTSLKIFFLFTFNFHSKYSINFHRHNELQFPLRFECCVQTAFTCALCTVHVQPVWNALPIKRKRRITTTTKTKVCFYWKLQLCYARFFMSTTNRTVHLLFCN